MYSVYRPDRVVLGTYSKHPDHKQIVRVDFDERKDIGPLWLSGRQETVASASVCMHLGIAMRLREILDAEIDRVLADAYDENEQRDLVAQRNLAIIGGGTELPGEVG